VTRTVGFENFPGTTKSRGLTLARDYRKYALDIRLCQKLGEVMLQSRVIGRHSLTKPLEETFLTRKKVCSDVDATHCQGLGSECKAASMGIAHCTELMLGDWTQPDLGHIMTMAPAHCFRFRYTGSSPMNKGTKNGRLLVESCCQYK
jgi:hypothetical protein